MKARREYRNREETQVKVLDALVDRSDEGMTVFELRSRADVEIDELEGALGELKREGLIEVAEEGDRAVIRPDERVVPDPGEREGEPSLIERVIDRLPF